MQRYSGDRSQRYILTVSTSHPHKNFRRLLLAYAEYADKRKDVNLVIAGLRGFDSGQIDQLIPKLDLGEKVRCTGWIPREELYALFAGADAFILPDHVRRVWYDAAGRDSRPGYRSRVPASNPCEP